MIDFTGAIHYIYTYGCVPAPDILPPCSSGRSLNSCLPLAVMKFGSYAMIPREQSSTKRALSCAVRVPGGAVSAVTG